MRLMALAAGVLAAMGCVDVSGRIAGELTRFGLDERRAECVGERLEERLSSGQLRQLAAAARAYGREDPDPERLSAADLARAAAEIEDPAVPIALASAGIGCGVRLADVL